MVRRAVFRASASEKPSQQNSPTHAYSKSAFTHLDTGKQPNSTIKQKKLITSKTAQVTKNSGTLKSTST